VISIDKFKSVAEKGFGFCDVIFGWDAGDVAYDNARFTGWHTGYPDATHDRSSHFPPDTLGREPAFFLCRFLVTRTERSLSLPTLAVEANYQTGKRCGLYSFLLSGI